MYLQRFDPWKNKLCSCPPKYSLNPYTGCAHACIYCYASSYIKDFFKCRQKPRLLEVLRREIRNIPKGSLISLCNTSDPYQPMERKEAITRECLKIFAKESMKVLIITKSDIVCRDIDLLKNMPSVVTITITTLKYYRKLEPFAPSPFERFKALERLNKESIRTALRFDPIIPKINEDEALEILSLAKSAGVSHVTVSTFKPRSDSWKRLKERFPERVSVLEDLYLRRGKRIGNSIYLEDQERERIIFAVREICLSLNLTFSTCREKLSSYNTSKSCDGSHLIEGGQPISPPSLEES